MNVSGDKVLILWGIDAELQGVLKSLIQHCSYTRIERELLPEKEAAAEEKKTVIEENEVKQQHIDNIVANSVSLGLNDAQVSKLLSDTR